MSSSGDWSANDYSNIITISSAAIASVLLVLFKSRCKKISICFGLLSCDRVVQSDSEEEDTDDKKKLNTTPNIPSEPSNEDLL
tara:strand:+ start:1801 stop:2049 length:249 start_codon:yes stop_codon:yes gene_type:complete